MIINIIKTIDCNKYISDDNKTMSFLVTLFTDLNLCCYFVVSRPQIFSFVILLLTIYLLELYVKKDDTNYLKFIPLLSFLEINLHAALWLFIPLYMLTFIIDSFKSKKLMLEGYRTKPLIITFVIVFLVALINPYGYKAITFIFNSYGDKYMLQYIYELQPFTFRTVISTHIFIIASITMLFYVYFRKGTVKVRYICMYMGTLLLGMNTVKGFSHFMLVSIFPLALLLKDIVPKNITDFKKWKKTASYIILVILSVGLTGYACYKYYKMHKDIEFVNVASEAVDAMDMFANGYPATTFVSFNDGGYLEFRGYRSYIDPRAEVYLKKNNHKEDIYEEYYRFENGLMDIDEFINKYHFDFIFTRLGDRLYNEESIDNYFVIYDMIDNGYRVYARNDVTTDEIRNMVIAEYEKSKQNRDNEK